MNVDIDKSLAILYNICIVRVAEHRIKDANVLVFNFKV